jgi:hypothetical protein
LTNFHTYITNNKISITNFAEDKTKYSYPVENNEIYNFTHGDYEKINNINFTFDGNYLNNLDQILTSLDQFKQGYSITNQIFILKHLEHSEYIKALTKVAGKNMDEFINETAKKFHMKPEDYKKFSENYGNLFKAGMVYRKDSNQTYIVEKMYNYINDSYSSSKLFSAKKPLIENILESYLPPPGSSDFSKSYITDFKVFYLFANYDEGNKGLNELKCKNQYDLLENTLGFIEAIRR